MSTSTFEGKSAAGVRVFVHPPPSRPPGTDAACLVGVSDSTALLSPQTARDMAAALVAFAGQASPKAYTVGDRVIRTGPHITGFTEYDYGRSECVLGDVGTVAVAHGDGDCSVIWDRTGRSAVIAASSLSLAPAPVEHYAVGDRVIRTGPHTNALGNDYGTSECVVGDVGTVTTDRGDGCRVVKWDRTDRRSEIVVASLSPHVEPDPMPDSAPLAVGDRVTLTGPPVDCDGARWDEVEPGTIGTVTNVYDDGDLHVTFDVHAQTANIVASSLSLHVASDGEPFAPSLGDRVTLTGPPVDCDGTRWAEVEPGTIGTVTCVHHDGDRTVVFDGLRHTVHIVASSLSPYVAPAPVDPADRKLRAGDRLRATREDAYSIVCAAGALGTVHGPCQEDQEAPDDHHMYFALDSAPFETYWVVPPTVAEASASGWELVTDGAIPSDPVAPADASRLSALTAAVVILSDSGYRRAEVGDLIRIATYLTGETGETSS